MTISCFPRSEEQLRRVVSSLTEAGFFKQYGEQAHGENILLTVQTHTFEEREKVQQILREAGITDFNYGEDTAA
jgi:hypothetical protein